MRILCHITLAACAAALALLGACVAPVQIVLPPIPTAPHIPLAVPVSDWHDVPATPGVWQWHREGEVSIARFGDAGHPALFSLVCNRPAGTVSLARDATYFAAGGKPTMPTTMTIHTTSQSRILPINPGGDAIAATTLPARDSLLDAMAYSRGRFAVAVSGLAWLYLPSWPEVSRVIEDCRTH